MYNDKTPRSPEEAQAQLNSICDFLALVHPSLVNAPEGFRPCVEIRPILRGKKDFALSKSLNLWDLSSESISRLREFLKLHHGQPTCIYYSVFTYDNHMKSMTKRGTQAKAGKITVASALDTSEIALDFDGIGYEDYTRLVDRLEEMGIHALWVFTGHGYQAHILLDEPLKDKSILKSFVFLARAKGFDCDPACVDPARVMRLPGTRNCKCFTSETYAYERNDPPQCKITKESDARYSLESIMASFEALPTVNEDDEKVYLNGREESSNQKATKPQKTDNAAAMSSDSFELRRIEYPFIQDFDLPEAVSKMLSYVAEGHRNKVLGALMKYFSKQHRLGKEPLHQIFSLWAQEACDPVYDEDEFEADFNRFYFFGGLNYDTSLARIYGPIDFSGLIELRKKELFIPHKFFKAFDKLSGQAIRLYLGIKMLEHTEEDATLERLAELLSISVRSLRTTIQELTDNGMVYVTTGVRKLKIPNTYHTDRFNSKKAGYMSLSYNDIKAYVTELYEPGSRGNGELKVYLHLRWKFYSGNIFVSQITLGETLGLAQNSISVIVNRLQDRHFLKIEKVHYGAIESCRYKLLR